MVKMAHFMLYGFRNQKIKKKIGCQHLGAKNCLHGCDYAIVHLVKYMEHPPSARH